MGNPYQYSGKGEGFLTDYSGLAAAGSGFQSFADAYMKAKHQQNEDMERTARMTSLANQDKRAAEDQALKEKLAGVVGKRDAGGGISFDDIPLTEKQKYEQSAKGQTGGYMPNPENPSEAIFNPKSVKAKEIEAHRLAGTNRVDSKEKLQAENTFNKDPILNAFVPRLEGAQKILNLITAARGGDIKANQAVLGQLNAEIARLENGSQSPGLHASEKTELEDKLAQFQNVRDTWTGKVTNVDLGDKFDASESLVRDLGHSIHQSVGRRAQFLSAGGTPAQKEIYAAKSGVLDNQYGGRFAPLPKKQQSLAQEPPSFFGRLGGLVGFGPSAQAKPPPADLENKAKRLRELDAKAGQ